MKYGIREICDVVLKAKSKQKIGNKTFFKNEPVIYFDSLKTSSLEGASTTVYAQGGRGNTRLMAWEGERTLTFTMEDALISPEGFMILSGAGLIDASESNKIKQHMTETVSKGDSDITIAGTKNQEETAYTAVTSITIDGLDKVPYVGTGSEAYVYVFFMKDGEIISEPYLAFGHGADTYSFVAVPASATFDGTKEYYTHTGTGNAVSDYTKQTELQAFAAGTTYYTKEANENHSIIVKAVTDKYSIGTEIVDHVNKFDAILVDYYTEVAAGAKQIDITADSFGGNFYLEASTLWRKQNGADVAAEFVIPNCKVQSNFTFTMASSGDPSTFTFTLDAFPDYTRFNTSKKVLAAIQIVDDEDVEGEGVRTQTWQN